MFWSWYEWPDAVDYYYLRRLSPPLRLAAVEFGGVSLLGAPRARALVARRRAGGRSGPGPALLWIAGWTLSTVVFFLFSRYRLPVVPALLLLAALPLAAIPELFRAGARRRALVARRVCLAALAAPHLAGFRPRMDLVHYNLARIAEGQGRAEAAAAHDRAALRLDPSAFLPHLTLGNRAARAGDLDAALAHFRRAAALEPRSPEAWSNLGGAYLATGTPPAPGAPSSARWRSTRRACRRSTTWRSWPSARATSTAPATSTAGPWRSIRRTRPPGAWRRVSGTRSRPPVSRCPPAGPRRRR